MKHFILIIGLFIYIVAFAPNQKCPLVRVYAYSQPVLQGAFPASPVEEGKSESKSLLRAEKLNYFIYAFLRENAFVAPSVIWINKQGYEVTKDTISNLPVKIPGKNASGKSVEIVLVPATPRTVIRLTPGTQMNFFAPPVPYLQKLLDANQMVIEYMWKEEICYFPISKIKKLEAVAAE